MKNEIKPGATPGASSRDSSSPARPPRWAYLFLILPLLFWAGNSIVARGLREEVSPIALNFWRWFTALLILLPFTTRRMIAERSGLLREWKTVVLLGVLGVVLYQTFLYQGLTATTATNAALFNSSIPVIIIVLSWVLYRERVSMRQLGGIAVSLLGVVVIMAKGRPALLMELRFNPGDLWILASLPVWSLYTVLLRRRLSALDPMALVTASALAGMVFLTPLYLFELSQGSRMSFSFATVGAVLYVAVFASAAGFTLWNIGVQRVGANRAGIFMHLHPAFTAALAIPILGESLHIHQGVGIALIFAGIYLSTTAGAAVES